MTKISKMTKVTKITKMTKMSKTFKITKMNKTTKMTKIQYHCIIVTCFLLLCAFHYK